MMRPDRRDSGFTLVELVVYIAVASVVTMAAITVLLLGLRINKQSTDTVKNQNTTRILLSALEDAATEGVIDEVIFDELDWSIMCEGRAIFSYSYENQTISTSGTVLMEGILSSTLELDENLLTVSVETEAGIYTSSVYCRMTVSSSGSSGYNGEEVQVEASKLQALLNQFNTSDEKSDEEENTASEENARLKFLSVLVKQYGSKGEIKGATASPKYFSEWFIGDYAKNPGWNSKTPWCACYVSWGLNQVLRDNAPRYANVDRFKEYFEGITDEDKTYGYIAASDAACNPVPGDIVFFDWIINSVSDPQHVGVVLYKTETYLYTIEGNSDNMVAIRKYPLDSAYIIGYGVLNWPTK